MLKEFNITEKTHILIQEARYVPRGFPIDGLDKMCVYILYGKSDKRLWIVELFEYVNPSEFDTKNETSYTMNTLKDVSDMCIDDIRVEYNVIVDNGLYPTAHYIYDTHIAITMFLPIMKQHQRQFKIKKLMAKIKES